jgi:hypothetical protein
MVCRKVWPTATIMLCLWHVRKAWAENLVQKINSLELRLEIHKGLADLIYSSDLLSGAEAVEHAVRKFEELKRKHTSAVAKDFFCILPETVDG